MDKRIIEVRTDGAGAPRGEPGEPAPEKRVRGEPKTLTYNHFEGEEGRLYCGIWESTAGTVKINYTEWEFCHLIAGEAILTSTEGERWTFKEGSAFIIPPGFEGTWETVRPVRKHYVILTPKE
jgi:uncharacterized cupin superfamily protein